MSMMNDLPSAEIFGIKSIVTSKNSDNTILSLTVSDDGHAELNRTVEEVPFSVNTQIGWCVGWLTGFCMEKVPHY